MMIIRFAWYYIGGGQFAYLLQGQWKVRKIGRAFAVYLPKKLGVLLGYIYLQLVKIGGTKAHAVPPFYCPCTSATSEWRKKIIGQGHCSLCSIYP